MSTSKLTAELVKKFMSEISNFYIVDEKDKEEKDKKYD